MHSCQSCQRRVSSMTYRFVLFAFSGIVMMLGTVAIAGICYGEDPCAPGCPERCNPDVCPDTANCTNCSGQCQCYEVCCNGECCMGECCPNGECANDGNACTVDYCNEDGSPEYEPNLASPCGWSMEGKSMCTFDDCTDGTCPDGCSGIKLWVVNHYDCCGYSCFPGSVCIEYPFDQVEVLYFSIAPCECEGLTCTTGETQFVFMTKSSCECLPRI